MKYIVVGRTQNNESALHLCDSPDKMRATAEELARTTRHRVDVFGLVSSVDPVLEVTSLNWSASVPQPALPQQGQQEQPPQQENGSLPSASITSVSTGMFGKDDGLMNFGNFQPQPQSDDALELGESDRAEAQQQ